MSQRHCQHRHTIDHITTAGPSTASKPGPEQLATAKAIFGTLSKDTLFFGKLTQKKATNKFQAIWLTSPRQPSSYHSRMSFGLHNVSDLFQGMMDCVLSSLDFRFLVYGQYYNRDLVLS
jgi:hypothetical protein